MADDPRMMFRGGHLDIDDGTWQLPEFSFLVECQIRLGPGARLDVRGQRSVINCYIECGEGAAVIYDANTLTSHNVFPDGADHLVLG